MATELRCAVGHISDRQAAKAALTELRNRGFDMGRVSVITQRPKTMDIQGATVSTPKQDKIANAVHTGTTVGGVSGGTAGILVTLGILAAPGVGPIVEASIILANMLLGGIIGAAGGGLVGVLVGWKLPNDRTDDYSDRIYDSEGYFLRLEGDASALQLAQAVLKKHWVKGWRIFSPSAPDRAPMNSAKVARQSAPSDPMV